MLTVHHLGHSQSDRVVWLCEELGIPYEFIRYERDPVSRAAPASYRALHPGGTAPVITDNGIALGESGAIIEYIMAKYGSGGLAVTPDQPNYADYLYWFHFANGTMMPSLLIELIVVHMMGTPADHPMTTAFGARIARGFAMMEARLAEADYFAGDSFSAADIIMFYPLTTMRHSVPHDLTDYPHIRAYLQRVGARPAYRRAMAKADPDLALKLD